MHAAVSWTLFIRLAQGTGKLLRSPCPAVTTLFVGACLFLLLRCAVGHSWAGALPHHHQQLLPWRTRHHREQLGWGRALRCAGLG